MSIRLALQALLSAAVGAGLTAMALLPSSGSVAPLASTLVAYTPEGELQRLRTELAALRAAPAPSLREAADGGPSAEPATWASNVCHTTSDAALLQRLLGELDEQRHSGPLAAYFGPRTVELTEVLLRIWVETGAPQRAFGLLAAVDAQLPDLGNEYRLYVARALRDQKRPEALDAYLLVLAHDVCHREALDDLAHLDAHGALAALELRMQANDLGDEQRKALPKERVRLLFAAGRKAEAIALLQTLLPGGEVGDDLLQRLIEHAPKSACEHFQQRMASATEDGARHQFRRLLVQALRAAGDSTAARRELEAMLAVDPDDDGALTELAKLDPAAAEARFRQRYAQPAGRAELLRLANGLRAAGNQEEAAAIEWQEFTATPGDDELQDTLLASRSLPLAERMLEHARALPTPPEDYDELLGNVADTLWHHGQGERAIALWRQARAIEPSDSEWTEKLAAVAAGRDPLGSRRGDWWRHSGEGDF